MPEEISPDDIVEAAKAPKRVTGDEGTVEERSVEEMIEADRYEKAQDATSPPFGMRMAKIRYPGTP